MEYKPYPKDNNFLITSNGDVIKLHENGMQQILKKYLIGKYYHVYINRKKSTPVHQIMAVTYLNHEINKKMVIDHIDNNQKNNNIKNLQIISHKSNVQKDSKYYKVDNHKNQLKLL